MSRLTAARAATHLAGALTVATAATLVPATTATAAPAAARGATPVAQPWPGHPDRAVVRYRVRPGDTATGLAVRYHAWTAELLRLNGLGSHGSIYQGQLLRIPIVISAMRRAGGHVPRFAHAKPATKPKPRTTEKQHQQRPRKHTKKHRTAKPVLIHAITPRKGWLHADLSRDEIRRLVSRMARRYDVPRTLALAIAWQESGWQQRRVSSAGALGVMQVMPDTGRWMRWYAGRKLRLRDTHDNILAGMLTLRTLRSWTRYDNNAIAAYYQGLGAVREHGHFRDTKQYVRSVRAHQRHLMRTGSPI